MQFNSLSAIIVKYFTSERAYKLLNIILNPNSGEGKKRRLQRAALERFRARGQALRVFETEKAGQATHLAHDLTQEGEGDVIVVGGDGTLHEVVNGFTNFDKCALGLIPTGTGNDFAAAAGIPLDPVKAADLILDSQPQYTEYMQMPQGVRGITPSARASTWKFCSAAAPRKSCAADSSISSA